MKVAVIVSVLVIATLLVPSDSANFNGRKHSKRAVAGWVGWALFGVNLGLATVPDGQALEAAIDNIVTAAGTTPFNINNLLSAIFSVVEAAINMSDNNSPSPAIQQLDTLMEDICTLVTDAVDGNFNVLATDIDNVVCAAEALGGLTNCNLSPLSGAINKLVSDATTKNVAATTIVSDAFGIATAAVTVATESASSMSSTAAVAAGVQKLLNDICTLVNDCITANSLALGGAITAVVTDSIALGTM